MLTLGLTGSVGMGKSTTAALLRRLGLPVHDADANVHDLLRPGGAAVAAVLRAFGAVDDGRGGIDRLRLGRLVFGDPVALRRLERILHPLVGKAERRFRAAWRRRRARIVVLDVPLLFETGGAMRCDAVILVTAPAFLQRQRVLGRPGMTPRRFADILARQMPDAEKRRRADYIVQTGIGRRAVLGRLRVILDRLDRGLDRRRRPGVSLRSSHRSDRGPP